MVLVWNPPQLTKLVHALKVRVGYALRIFVHLCKFVPLKLTIFLLTLNLPRKVLPL